jgi:alpha-1,4-digalacturonate transport system substrate-binding protein
MRRRSLLAAATCVVLSLGLAACGGGETGSDTPADPGKPLQFVLSGDANQGGGYATMAKKYEQATGTKIEVVDVPYDDLNTKVRNAALAKDLPALGRMPAIDPTWLDSTVDLKAVAEKNKVNTALAAVDADGKVVSLPSDLTAVGLYLNKNLFDQAGVKYPTAVADIWTWDEFVAAVKQVQAKTDAKYGMVMDRSSHRLSSFLYEFGSEGFNPDAQGQYQTNDQTKVALEYFKKLNDDKFMPRSVWLSEADPSALFKSGKVAAYYSGSWQIADFAKNIKDFEPVSVYLPQEKVRAANYGTAANMVVFDGTGQEKQATDFLSWLYAPENYAELAKISGFLPVVEGVKVDYTTNAKAFQLYNEEIAATPKFVEEQKKRDLKLQVEGKTTDGDPMREETIKYLNNEQDVDKTIANIKERLTDGLS